MYNILYQWFSSYLMTREQPGDWEIPGCSPPQGVRDMAHWAQVGGLMDGLADLNGLFQP